MLALGSIVDFNRKLLFLVQQQGSGVLVNE